MTVAEYLEVDRVGKAGGKPESLPQMQRVLPKIGAQCVSPEPTMRVLVLGASVLLASCGGGSG